MSVLLTPVVDHRYELVRIGERFACFWIVRDLSTTPFGASWSDIDLTLAVKLLLAAARGHQLHPILTAELTTSDTRNRQFTLGAAAEKYLSGAMIPWRETGQRLAVNAHNLPVQFADNPLNWGTCPSDGLTWFAMPAPWGGQMAVQGESTSDKPNHADPLSEYHRRRAQSRLPPVARNSATWRTFPRSDGKLQGNLSDLVMRPVLVNGCIQIPLRQYLNETEISVLVTAGPQDAVEILTEGGLP